MDSAKRITLGKQGEEFAEKLLRKQGYKIKERNYRCMLGELDIIAMDGKILVFIEVRSRSSLQYGTGGESVNRRKQNKIKKLAQFYLMSNKITKTDCRFDVVSIYASSSGLKADLFKNAFF